MHNHPLFFASDTVFALSLFNSIYGSTRSIIKMLYLYSHYIFHLVIYRLVSRAVLFQFKPVCPRSCEEQDDQDIKLARAMEDAHGAVGEIVALGKSLILARQEFVRTVLPQVQSALSEAIHRVQHSYGLSIFASLKVC